MPTEVIKTVKSSGGDYTSLSAYEAGEQKDLVAADEIAVAECHNLEDTYTDTNLSFSGWTTDATRFIHIRTPVTASHSGVFGTGSFRLKFVNTGGSNRLGLVLSEFAQVSDILFSVQTDSTGQQAASQNTVVSTTQTFERCIFRGLGGVGSGQERGPWQAGGDGLYHNCVAYDLDQGFIQSHATGTIDTRNCVAQNIANNGFWSAGAGTFTATNCIAQDCTDGFTAGVTGDYNISDIASDAPGGNSVQATLTFADKAGDDFHLSPSDTSAIDAGDDLSAHFSDDIDGQTRPMGESWDIGVDEYGGAAITHHRWKRDLQYVRSGGSRTAMTKRAAERRYRRLVSGGRR